MPQDAITALMCFGLFFLGLLVSIPVLFVQLSQLRSLLGLHKSRIQVLSQRLAELEHEVRRLRPASDREHPAEIPQPEPAGPPDVERQAEVQRPPPVEQAPAAYPRPLSSLLPKLSAVSAPQPQPTSGSEPDWELLLGRRALGYAAVVVLLFGAAFFLRYALEHDWIGPTGQIGIAVAAGAMLLIAGRRYDRPGFRPFSQGLSAAGLLVLYLANYASYGFFELIDRDTGATLLTAVVVLGALLAAGYNAWSIASLTVIGGLLVPVLMASPHDQYQALFLYLLALNAGTVLLAAIRPWPGVATLALLGSQLLFLLWYNGHFHPNKLLWAVGFQTGLLALYVGFDVITHAGFRRVPSLLDLLRVVAVPGTTFLALFALLSWDHAAWQGSVALGFAVLYTVLARSASLVRPMRPWVVVLLAIAAGFVGIVIPLEANAHWIALGWAVLSLMLWALAVRIGHLELPKLAGLFALLAVWRLMVDFVPPMDRAPFTPVFNGWALPALGVAACFLVACGLGQRWRRYLDELSQPQIPVLGMLGLTLVMLILSNETYGYFVAIANVANNAPELAAGLSATTWRWIAHVALTMLWAGSGVLLLSLGIGFRIAPLRWFALLLLALSVAKVFLVDLAHVRDLYRVLAFVVLAILLGISARLYQPLGTSEPGRRADDAEKSSNPKTQP